MATDHILTSLPPLRAALVSAETRLGYVLRHFRLAYPDAPSVAIGYADSHPAITVAGGAGDFFQQHTSYPAAPNFRDWAGQRVPFFFDKQPEASLLRLSSGHAEIGVDIISAAFYLLSGWQEYFSDTRDRHGRFPYVASVQHRYGFVALPVVNYYFDLLKTAVEHVSGEAVQPRRWAGGAPFAAFITHDIDNLQSGWKSLAKAALQRGNLVGFGKRLGQHLTRPDAWDNLEAVAATVAEHGARSTFFILPEHHRAADGTPNADYRMTPALRQRLRELQQQGVEIGLHSSIGSSTNPAQLTAERREKLALEIAGHRFHYLKWEPRTTPGLLCEAALSYDSTLGFAEHFGFRHSYCLPFYPFDFAAGEACSFLEIPLNVMDTTLYHPNYLQLRPNEILPALRPMFDEISQFGGVATVLWHNDHFDPVNTRTGPQQFAEIMGCLRAHGAAFLTGSQIMAEL